MIRQPPRSPLFPYTPLFRSVLVFPPTLFMWGARGKPEMALRHFSEIAAQADLPIIVFEYPPASGIGYSPETLARSEEHTSELQSQSNLVCRLLLEKKKRTCA